MVPPAWEILREMAPETSSLTLSQKGALGSQEKLKPASLPSASISVCMGICSHQALSHVQLFSTPWTAASQAPLSMELRKWKLSENESLSVVSDSLRPHGLYSPWDSPGQNTGVGSLSLLQEIFPTQGSNPGLPHYRRILYQLNYQAIIRIHLGIDITCSQSNLFR